MTIVSVRVRATAPFVAFWLASMTLFSLAQEGRTPLLRDIEIGIRQVRRRAFDAARVTLAGVVRRLEETKAGPDPDLARAYLYLGAAYWGLGNEDLASEQFRAALENDGSVNPAEEKDLESRALELVAKTRSASSTGDSTTPSRSEPSASPAAERPEGATGVLQLGVKPWATVSIDGRDHGSSPIAPVPLAAGAHTIRLTHPDYQTVQRKVTIQAAGTLKLLVDLELVGIRAAPSSAAEPTAGSENLTTLFADLASPDRGRRSQATEKLASAGDDAVEGLGKALKSPDPQVRGRAAWVLGRINTTKARALAPALRQLLTDSDLFVRKAAEEALARMGSASPSR